MSKRFYICLFIYLSIYLSSRGQVNLVPNYSFEEYTNCSVQMGVPTLPFLNYTVKNWYTFDYMTPDYFNVCANFDVGNPYPIWASVPLHKVGNQMPKTGDAYVGIGLYDIGGLTDTVHASHEMIAIELKNSLKSQTCYYGEFWANLAEISGFCTNQLGMLLTSTTFSTTLDTYTNTINPQIQWDSTKYFTDSINWVKISGTFIAQGGEKLIVIGNFKDGLITKKINSNSQFVCPPFFPQIYQASYVHIDDVSLYELPNQTGTQSYTLCAGDSLLLGDTVSLPMRYQWSLNGLVVDTTKNITITNAGTYVLQTKHCTTQTQTITVVVDDGCNPTEPIIPNVFTPNGDNVNDTFSFKVVGAKSFNFTVYNRWGISLTSALSKGEGATTTTQKIMWDGRTTSGIECSAGIYFYVLEYTDANGELKKKNGYISLIR